MATLTRPQFIIASTIGKYFDLPWAFTPFKEDESITTDSFSEPCGNLHIVYNNAGEVQEIGTWEIFQGYQVNWKVDESGNTTIKVYSNDTSKAPITATLSSYEGKHVYITVYSETHNKYYWQSEYTVLKGIAQFALNGMCEAFDTDIPHSIDDITVDGEEWVEKKVVPNPTWQMTKFATTYKVGEFYFKPLCGQREFSFPFLAEGENAFLVCTSDTEIVPCQEKVAIEAMKFLKAVPNATAVSAVFSAVKFS